jgi:hypothetical protein
MRSSERFYETRALMKILRVKLVVEASSQNPAHKVEAEEEDGRDPL